GIVYEFLYDGVFQWFYRIFDIGGNSIDSSNYTITIDTIIPETIFGVGTEISNLNFSRNWIYVNVSVNETNEANVTFGLYNLTNDVNVTTFYDGTRVVNWTNLDDAIYYYNVTTYDLSNQINYTETREIWLDDTGPTIIIDHPQPKTYGYNTSLPFNFSVNDNLVGRSGCWWNVDESTNQSIDCDTNTTFNSTEGEHTLYMYSNDSLNNLASNNVTFSISTLGPATTLNYPNNNRFLNYTGWVLFNYSVVDPDGVDLCRLYGNWSGSWDINDSNSSVINDSLNYFNESINSEGTYIWNIWCNDSLSLESFALNNFTFGLDETIPLIEFGIGTQDTYYNLSQNFIYVNVSVNETNEANITFGLYNSSGDVNVTVFTDGTRTINWTTLGDGNYSYNVSIYDKAINYNFTETRNLTLNTIDPSGNLSIPLNLSYDNVTSKNLTVNMSDNIELDNATLFVINSSDSIINTTIQNLSGTEYFLGIVYEFLYDGVFQWFYRIFDIGG
ncbi:hypothetical protein GOV12_02985, partial [Candidatus Pacearchaeota archaeon]|nr:hypothetical protein [Candidatus Pacearchaeota archaeon]